MIIFLTLSRAAITLAHRAQMKRFTSDLLRVLKSQPAKQVSLLDLPAVYEKAMGRQFRITDYGVRSPNCVNLSSKLSLIVNCH